MSVFYPLDTVRARLQCMYNINKSLFLGFYLTIPSLIFNSSGRLANQKGFQHNRDTEAINTRRRIYYIVSWIDAST